MRAAVTPPNIVSGPKYFAEPFDEHNDPDQPKANIGPPKVVKVTPLCMRRAAAVRSPESSPDNSPCNSPPDSPRLNGERPWYILDHPEISCRGLEPGPSILKREGSIKKGLHIHWRPKFLTDCETAYPVYDYVD